MFRPWPNTNEKDTFLVLFPKKAALLHVSITGIFFVFISVCIFFSGKVFAAQGVTAITLLGLVIFGLLWVCTGYFFIKYLKVFLGRPLVTFLANREGVFLDISVKSKEAFFIPWTEINGFSIRKVTDPFWNEAGFKTRSDTLSISFTEKFGQNVPQYAKNVAVATKTEINLHADRIDLDLKNVVDKLSAMKARCS